MDEATLAGIEQRHTPVEVQTGSKTHGGGPEFGTFCKSDRQEWPCDSERLRRDLADTEEALRQSQRETRQEVKLHTATEQKRDEWRKRAEAAEAALADLRAALEWVRELGVRSGADANVWEKAQGVIDRSLTSAAPSGEPNQSPKETK